jgi:hypothetical protein
MAAEFDGAMSGSANTCLVAIDSAFSYPLTNYYVWISGLDDEHGANANGRWSLLA